MPAWLGSACEDTRGGGCSEGRLLRRVRGTGWPVRSRRESLDGVRPGVGRVASCQSRPRAERVTAVVSVLRQYRSKVGQEEAAKACRDLIATVRLEVTGPTFPWHDPALENDDTLGPPPSLPRNAAESWMPPVRTAPPLRFVATTTADQMGEVGFGSGAARALPMPTTKPVCRTGGRVGPLSIAFHAACSLTHLSTSNALYGSNRAASRSGVIPERSRRSERCPTEPRERRRVIALRCQSSALRRPPDCPV